MLERVAILLKRFMVWAIASNKIPSHNFKFLRLRLLVAYITAMAAILGISAAALYIFFARNLDTQLNYRLLRLVQTAVPSLDTIGDRPSMSFDRDLPWRNLFIAGKQSLEWFDSEGKLITRKGIVVPEFPLVKQISSLDLKAGSPVIQQQDLIRSVTISVYGYDSDKKNLHLKGYIRASQSTKPLERTLDGLRLGLLLGGITALFLILISSLYLTKQAIEPTLASYEKLSQFTADASHELRHPLTAISIATELMLARKQEIKPKDLKKLAIIQKSVVQMKDLVADLLFLARNDAPNLDPAPETIIFSLDEMLQDVLERFEPIAESKNITLKANLAANIAIKANPMQLTRLFANLFDNAIKYTQNYGSVAVSLTKIKRNALVEIQDTGIGIAKDRLPYIFERFWRADRARSRQADGFGLGLAIAFAIVEKHGGKIQVNSELGNGTCFRIYLPLS